jgi:hypothetical protein
VKQPRGDERRTVAAHLPGDSGGALARTGRWLRPGSGVVSFGHGRRRGREEARRAAVGAADGGREAFNPASVSGQRRPWQPTRTWHVATLPQTVGPHTSAFF